MIEEVQEETKINDTHLKNALQKVLEELPEGRKSILSMHYFDGLSTQEISQVLNISLRTVENQLYRAKKCLKVKLNEMGLKFIGLFLIIYLELSEYFDGFYAMIL